MTNSQRSTRLWLRLCDAVVRAYEECDDAALRQAIERMQQATAWKQRQRPRSNA